MNYDLELVNKGDTPGHPFRGNQYGSSGAQADAHLEAAKYHKAQEEHHAKGVQAWNKFDRSGVQGMMGEKVKAMHNAAADAHAGMARIHTVAAERMSTLSAKDRATVASDLKRAGDKADRLSAKANAYRNPTGVSKMKNIDPRDVLNRIQKSAAEQCSTCEGSGKIRAGKMKCPDCSGSGKAPMTKAEEPSAENNGQPQKKCPKCNGTGKMEGKVCPYCNGTGEMDDDGDEGSASDNNQSSDANKAVEGTTPAETPAKAEDQPKGTNAEDNDPAEDDNPKCALCDGTGKVHIQGTTCPDCNGTGKAPKDVAKKSVGQWRTENPAAVILDQLAKADNPPPSGTYKKPRVVPPKSKNYPNSSY